MTRGGRRRRLPLAVLLGAGVLAVPAPATAMTPDSDGGAGRGVALLQRAVSAQRTRSYSGEQYVGTSAGSMTVQVQHSAGQGSQVEVPGSGSTLTLPADDMDDALVDLLGQRYDVTVAGRARVAGRTALVVEARRPGSGGPGSVAARFWLDAATGLVLRREVRDGSGHLVRSSAFLELTVEVAPESSPTASPTGAADAPAPSVAAAVGRPAHEGLPAEAASAVQAAGWTVPTEMPGGLVLFQARLQGAGRARVLQLAYSDGLSTLSVFVQDGRLTERPGGGFVSRGRSASTVWVRSGAPERAVWSGAGRTFTVVADLPPAAVDAAVAALPHDRPVRGGLLHRLGRGLHRLGALLNPFS